ncbi:hypothetical protein Desaci_1120 [Desulfosporosinus acidiphilus SJ4]|uniref:DUF2089 domain-containing protein n=1 Tax=Desulfosporosinus acidiphilus (strain DSM 22704 / JCM 16185 / SJ4) TaxID=646529 RepID=I4D2Y3_DESAJ|nr:DUF2089 domain-containing protein [Desulfosporosinus acidiphilus]AFM40157.1 hypothetical protein Desaci_1120 [Desulfosporosinus acidiphilus SJ4]
MNYKMPHRCPVCDHELKISKLTCTHCPTKIEGEFSSCKFCRLPRKQIVFIEAFIKCRGNIKEVEKELGISYPTVRSRLDSVIEALSYSFENVKESAPENSIADEERLRRQEILEALNRGDISAQEATRQMRKQKGINSEEENGTERSNNGE